MEEEKKEKESKNGEIADLWKVFRQVKLSWGFIFLSLFAAIVNSLITLLIPDRTANLFNGDFSMDSLKSVISAMILSLIFGIGASLLRFLADARSVRAARNSVWKMMMNVKSSYYNEHDPASLLSIVTSDTQMLVSGLTQLFIFVPSSLVLLIGCFVSIGNYNKKLLAVVYIMLPIYLFYCLFVGRWQFRVGKKIQIRIGALTGYLAERIRNLGMIKTFTAENKEIDNGIDATGKLYQANREYRILSGVVNCYQLATVGISTTLAVLWGSHLLGTGEIDMKAWLAFFIFVPSINVCFMTLSIIWTFFKDFQGRAYRLARLIDAPNEIVTQKNKDTEDIPEGDAELKNVTFGYQKETILSDVSFRIPRGKVTALVGPSGSGKTTILKLFERLYDLNAGMITVGGEDINNFDIHDWRKSISYVVQDAGVFSGTVRDCLTYGTNEAVSDDELVRVTQMAGIYDYIQGLTDGFDTQLASWGSSMSGGQRQRLVIARELLKNVDILLFDEPTSALDPSMAEEISKLIFEQFKGKTIVMVTHELHFISNADQIVVLNQGKTEGIGTHQSLMTTCKTYRELVEEQSYQEVFGS